VSLDEKLKLPVIEVYFDGGFNPTLRCYGSWEVVGSGVDRKELKFRFDGVRVESSNSAEYLSLLNALVWLQQVKEKKAKRLMIYTDSTLVQHQVTGRHKTHQQHLKEFCAMVRNNLSKWGFWSIHWRSRVENVARFGH